MAYRQAKDFFQQIIQYNLDLCSVLERLNERLESQRVQILVEHIQDQSQVLQSYLEDYRKDGPSRILDYYFQYEPESSIASMIENLRELDQSDGKTNEEQFTDSIIKIQEQLVELVSKMSEMSQESELSELLESIAKAYRKNIREFVSNASTMNRDT